MHKYTDKSKRFVTEKILSTVPEDILTKQLCEELFERDYTKIEETLNAFKKKRLPVKSACDKTKEGRARNIFLDKWLEA